MDAWFAKTYQTVCGVKAGFCPYGLSLIPLWSFFMEQRKISNLFKMALSEPRTIFLPVWLQWTWELKRSYSLMNPPRTGCKASKASFYQVGLVGCTRCFSPEVSKFTGDSLSLKYEYFTLFYKYFTHPWIQSKVI